MLCRQMARFVDTIFIVDHHVMCALVFDMYSKDGKEQRYKFVNVCLFQQQMQVRRIQTGTLFWRCGEQEMTSTICPSPSASSPATT